VSEDGQLELRCNLHVSSDHHTVMELQDLLSIAASRTSAENSQSRRATLSVYAGHRRGYTRSTPDEIVTELLDQFSSNDFSLSNGRVNASVVLSCICEEGAQMTELSLSANVLRRLSEMNLKLTTIFI
jgi:hypothetical protein